jgi:hypothetical protein
MAGGYAFMPDALDANAAGRLTDSQHAMLEDGSFEMRVLPTVTGDLHKGVVAAVEGAVRKKRPVNLAQDSRSAGAQHYALEVGGVDYDVPSRRVWEEAPQMGWVRLYYLPRSRLAVNLEILPDHVVDSSPQDVISPLRDVLGSVFSPGLTKRSRIKRADRAAQAQAAVRSVMEAGSGQPNPSEPMSSAAGDAGDLVGSWTSAFFNVQVSGNGTLMIENSQGVHQGGQWRVDPNGQLHLRLDGGDGDDLITPFSASDGQLSIQFAGQQMILQRAK